MKRSSEAVDSVVFAAFTTNSVKPTWALSHVLQGMELAVVRCQTHTAMLQMSQKYSKTPTVDKNKSLLW